MYDSRPVATWALVLQVVHVADCMGSQFRVLTQSHILLLLNSYSSKA